MPLPQLADVLRLPLRLLPDGLHVRLAATAVNHLLRGQPLSARLAELEGRSLGIHIRDAGANLHFRIRNRRLVPAQPDPAGVVIRGNLRDFIDLATRAEDPDTLFFQRRLCIEGDTEVGLHVKNLLDALEYDWAAHVRAVLPAPLAEPAVAFAGRLGKLWSRHRG